MARLGSSSERLDLGVLVSPSLRAERHTWMMPVSRSTWVQVSVRSSPGRSPSVKARTNSASSRPPASSVLSRSASARQKRQVVAARLVLTSVAGRCSRGRVPQASFPAVRGLGGCGLVNGLDLSAAGS